MRQRKRMGLPTARTVASARRSAAVPGSASGPTRATAQSPLGGGTITTLMERLANDRHQEVALVPRHAIATGTSNRQPKVLRTRAGRT
jgi:hypothetical protein